MGMKPEPFAIQLFRRFLAGETISSLSEDLGIPPERIETRIRAAAAFQTRSVCNSAAA